MKSRGLIGVLLLGSSVTLAEPPLTAQHVLSSIASHGAAPTLAELYRDDRRWAALLAGIATGDSTWLDAAKKLHRASDAGSSEQLELAVGEALEHQPEKVLSSAVEEFRLDLICGPPDIDDIRYRTYAKAIAAIEKRERRLKLIDSNGVQAHRDSCIALLEEARSTTRKVFDRP